MAESKIKLAEELTRGRLLAQNTLINVLGYGLPLVVALFAIPLLVDGLGTERFGVLTLAWVFIGYLSLFDMGLGRALTKLVSEKIGTDQRQEIPALIWTAVWIMFFIGSLVALLVSQFLPYLIRNLIKVPPFLVPETLKSFYLFVFFVPVVTVSVGFRGILDAHQRFDLTNMVRIPLGIYTFLAPLFILPFSKNLFPIAGVLVLGRLAACAVQILFCFRIVPGLRQGITMTLSAVRPLIRFGGWMTVTNVISPLMIYLDRFFIGALISVTAVAHYATPSEVITKLLLISGSLMGVLFPAFSTSYVQNRARTARLFKRGVIYVFIVIFPLILVIFTLAHEGLTLWLGQEFARHSTSVLQWIALGVLIQSVGQVPYALIQGIGRPDLTGKLHIVELPFYIAGLIVMIDTNGIVGAAMVWFFRIGVDTMVMFFIAQRLLSFKISIIRQKIGLLVVMTGMFLCARFLESFSMKVLFLVSSLCIHFFWTWYRLLNEDEKSLILERLNMFHRSKRS